MGTMPAGGISAKRGSFAAARTAARSSDMDAQVLADAHAKMAQILGVEMGFPTAEAIQERYAELIALAAVKKAKKKTGNRKHKGAAGSGLEYE